MVGGQRLGRRLLLWPGAIHRRLLLQSLDVLRLRLRLRLLLLLLRLLLLMMVLLLLELVHLLHARDALLLARLRHLLLLLPLRAHLLVTQLLLLVPLDVRDELADDLPQLELILLLALEDGLDARVLLQHLAQHWFRADA